MSIISVIYDSTRVNDRPLNVANGTDRTESRATGATYLVINKGRVFTRVHHMIAITTELAARYS